MSPAPARRLSIVPDPALETLDETSPPIFPPTESTGVRHRAPKKGTRSRSKARASRGPATTKPRRTVRPSEAAAPTPTTRAELEGVRADLSAARDAERVEDLARAIEHALGSTPWTHAGRRMALAFLGGMLPRLVWSPGWFEAHGVLDAHEQLDALSALPLHNAERAAYCISAADAIVSVPTTTLETDVEAEARTIRTVAERLIHALDSMMVDDVLRETRQARATEEHRMVAERVARMSSEAASREPSLTRIQRIEAEGVPRLANRLVADLVARHPTMITRKLARSVVGPIARFAQFYDFDVAGLDLADPAFYDRLRALAFDAATSKGSAS